MKLYSGTCADTVQCAAVNFTLPFRLDGALAARCSAIVLWMRGIIDLEHWTDAYQSSSDQSPPASPLASSCFAIAACKPPILSSAKGDAEASSPPRLPLSTMGAGGTEGSFFAPVSPSPPIPFRLLVNRAFRSLIRSPPPPLLLPPLPALLPALPSPGGALLADEGALLLESTFRSLDLFPPKFRMLSNSAPRPPPSA